MKRRYSFFSREGGGEYSPSKRRMIRYHPRYTTNNYPSSTKLYGLPLSVKVSRALRAVNKLRQQVELKHIDLGASLTQALATTGTWATTMRILMNPCSQGTSETTRIGKTTNLRSLIFRAYLNLNAAEGQGAFARFVIFFDRKPAGANPSPTDIFSTDNVLSPLSSKNSGRFLILHDEFYTFSNNDFVCPIKLFLDLRRTGHCDYGLGNNGTIADISKGALFFWVSFGSIDHDAGITYDSRVRFSDS